MMTDWLANMSKAPTTMRCHLLLFCNKWFPDKAKCVDVVWQQLSWWWKWREVGRWGQRVWRWSRKGYISHKISKIFSPFMKTKVAGKISVLTFCQFCPWPNLILPSEVTQQWRKSLIILYFWTKCKVLNGKPALMFNSLCVTTFSWRKSPITKCKTLDIILLLGNILFLKRKNEKIWRMKQ